MGEGRSHEAGAADLGLDCREGREVYKHSPVCGDGDCPNQNESTEVLSGGGGRVETDLSLGESRGSAVQPWYGGHCSLPNSADTPNFLPLGHLLYQAPLHLGWLCDRALAKGM